MKKIEKQIDKLNRIYEKYKGVLNGAFHTFLWAILVDEARKADGNSALTYNYVGPNRIGIADRGTSGYTPVCFGFNDEADKSLTMTEIHEKRQAIVDDLNRDIFDIEPEPALLIAVGTMATGK